MRSLSALGARSPSAVFILGEISTALSGQGRFAEAEDFGLKALQARTALNGPDDPSVATALNNLGVLYGSFGFHAKAEPLLRRALAIRERTDGPTSRETIAVVYNLGSDLSEQARYQEAEPLLRRALAARQGSLPAAHPDRVNAEIALAIVLRSQGHYDEAIAALSHVLAAQESALGTSDAALAPTLANLGIAQGMSGQSAEALQTLARAEAILKAAGRSEDPVLADVRDDIGDVYVGNRDYEKGADEFRAAAEIQRHAFGDRDLRLASSLYRTGQTQVMLNKFDLAKQSFDEASAIYEAAGDALQLAQIRFNLAQLADRQGDATEADRLIEQAVQIAATKSDHASAANGKLLADVAQYESLTGRNAAALPLAERTLTLIEGVGGRDTKEWIDAAATKGGILLRTGTLSEAAATFASVLETSIKLHGADSVASGWALLNQAELERAALQFAAAAGHSRDVLDIGQRHSNDRLVAAAANNLGLVEPDQGDYEHARARFELAVQMSERTLGPDVRDGPDYLLNLASVLRRAGHYDAAEQAAQRALALQQQLLPPDDIDIAGTWNSLGLICLARSQLDDAERWFRQALDLRERRLGETHPDTALSLGNLGRLYIAKGRLLEAEPLTRRALAATEAVRGPDHPDVAFPLADLADIAMQRGDYTAARTATERVLAIERKWHGEEYQGVAGELAALGALDDVEGRTADAEEHYLRSLSLYETALGPDHPSVADTLTSLGLHFVEAGRFVDASPLLDRALAIRKAVFGADSTRTIASVAAIALLDDARGNTAEAIVLLERSAQIQQAAFGPQHPILAQTLLSLGIAYTRVQRYDDARRALDRVEAIQAATPTNELAVAAMSHARAMLLAGEKHYADAVELQQRAIARVEAVLGDASPSLAPTLNNLGLTLSALDRRDEAEHAYLRALAIYRKAYGEMSARCAVVMWNLAALYEAEGRTRDAKKMLGRAAGILGSVPRDDLAPNRWL